MTERNSRSALALSFLVGGLAAGSLAFLFAPRLARVHKAFFGRTDTLADRDGEMDDGEAYCAEEGTYRVIPEGAEICSGEETDV